MYLTPSQLLCVHQKETACNCSKRKVANKKVFPNKILGSRFVSRSLVPLDKPGVTIRLVPLKGMAIASTVYNDDPCIVQQRFLSRVNRWLYNSIVFCIRRWFAMLFHQCFQYFVFSVCLSVSACLPDCLSVSLALSLIDQSIITYIFTSTPPIVTRTGWPTGIRAWMFTFV